MLPRSKASVLSEIIRSNSWDLVLGLHKKQIGLGIASRNCTRAASEDCLDVGAWHSDSNGKDLKQHPPRHQAFGVWGKHSSHRVALGEYSKRPAPPSPGSLHPSAGLAGWLLLVVPPALCTSPVLILINVSNCVCPRIHVFPRTCTRSDTSTSLRGWMLLRSLIMLSYPRSLRTRTLQLLLV